MSGFITKVECEANREFLVDTYGEDFYTACLAAEGTTFLALLMEHGKI